MSLDCMWLAFFVWLYFFSLVSEIYTHVWNKLELKKKNVSDYGMPQKESFKHWMSSRFWSLYLKLYLHFTVFALLLFEKVTTCSGKVRHVLLHNGFTSIAGKTLKVLLIGRWVAQLFLHYVQPSTWLFWVRFLVSSLYAIFPVNQLFNKVPETYFRKKRSHSWIQ